MMRRAAIDCLPHMKILITGSSGHLGEALMRTLAQGPHEAVGVDILRSPFTSITGSIADRAIVDACMKGVDAVLHTATLHKPHVATHRRQDFIDTNVTGMLNLLEAAVANGVRSFVFTSTTSTFGDALTPPPGAPAVWITEDVVPIPKNIYGVTKVAAEDLCQLFHRNEKLPCLVLRTSRFFPEDDDVAEKRRAFDDMNLKVNELLYRRVDVEDVVSALLLAIEKAPALGFGRFIITATTPFTRDDAGELGVDAPAVLRRCVTTSRGRCTACRPASIRAASSRAPSDRRATMRHEFAARQHHVELPVGSACKVRHRRRCGEALRARLLAHRRMRGSPSSGLPDPEGFLRTRRQLLFRHLVGELPARLADRQGGAHVQDGLGFTHPR
jgi:nucleoside-diphosphate-sugar epimerase